MKDNYLKNELYELIKTDESIFDFIQESSLDGLWYWDLENPEEEWMNPKFWTVLGYDPEEMPHKSTAWQSIINQDDLKVATENFSRHCENPDHPYDQIVRYAHKNGSTVWIRCRGMAIRDKNGKPLRMLGAHHNITDTKRFMTELREQEASFRSIFDAMDEGVYIADPESYELIHVNEAFKRIFGEDVIGKKCYRVLQNIESPCPFCTNDKIFGDNLGQTCVWEFQNKVNKEWYHCTDKAIRWPDGRMVRLEVATNITERKLTEEALINSTKQTQRILDNLLDGYFQTDLNGSFTIVNPRALEMFGYKSDKELLGKPSNKLYANQGDREILLNKLMTGGIVTDYTCKGQRQDGTTFWISMSGRFIKDENDQITGTEGLARDITERIIAKEQIQRMSHIADIAPGGIVVHDFEGNFLYINENALRMHGYTKEEFAAMNINLQQFVAPESAELIPSRLEMVYKEGEVDFESTALRKDGTTFPEYVYSKRTEWDGKPAILSVFNDITERKQAEETLVASEAKLKAAFMTGPDGSYWATLKDGMILEVNERFQTIFGGSRDEFIGKTSLELDLYANPSDRVKVVAELKEHGFVRDIELQGRRLNGELFPVSLSIRVVVLAGQQFIFGNTRDITERKLAEETLRQSEDKYRQIADNISDVVWITDAELNTIYISPSIEKLVGEPADDHMSRSLEEKFPPEALNTLMQTIQEEMEIENDPLADKHRTRMIEIQHYKADGSIIWVSMHTSALRDSTGKIKGFQGVTRDITERKLVEDELRTTAERYRMAQVMGRVGHWSFSPITQAFNASPEASRIFGFYPDVEGSLEEIMACIAPSDAERSLSAMMKCAEDGTPYDQEILIHPRGTTEPTIIWSTAVRIIDEHGTPSILGVLQDITERKKAEIELITAKEKAEESDKLKTAFLNNISHEIRTPLNGILGFGAFLSETDSPPEEKKVMLAYVEQASKRLMNTITDYVDMAQIVSGTMELHKKELLLYPFLKNVLEDTRQLCAGKPIKFITDFQPDDSGLTLYSDPELIGRILHALLDNALKFTDKGSICCGLKLKEGVVEFFVKDTGKGIAPNMLDAIFNIFAQADPSNTRGHEGSGLGLSIASGLVKLLGGAISVSSEEGVGSVFSFTIPYAATELAEKSTKAGKRNTSFTGKPMVLIAEDEESNYLYIEVVLKAAELDYLLAKNGEEAVTFCRQHPEISMVLMDIKMPVMNGLEATRLIREFRPELPIFATTAYAQIGDEQRFLAAGCNGYLPKPIKKEKLLALIQKYFGID